MYVYMIKWNCVFIIWTLNSGSEISHLVVQNWAFWIGNIVFGSKNDHFEWIVLYLVEQVTIYKRMDNKNTILWFIFWFEIEELYKCKYNKILGKLWGKYEGF
jgi:hypothetical protein